MEWNQIEGNWENMKGKIREMWGKLSDNDLEIIKGKKQQLAGKLQERYGYTVEKAKTEIDKFIDKFDSLGKDRVRGKTSKPGSKDDDSCSCN